MSTRNVNTESNYGLPFGPLRVRTERIPGSVIREVFHDVGESPEAPDLIVRFPNQPTIRPRWWMAPNLCTDDDGGVCLTREPFTVESSDAVIRKEEGTVVLEVAKQKGDAAALRDRLSRYVEVVLQAVLAERGCTFLHASAVKMKDGAWVFPAWGQTGKTSMVLELLREGGEYLGDDLVIVDADGNVHPYPKAIGLYGYNAAELDFINPGFFLSRCRNVRRRDRILSRISRKFIPRRRSAIFQISELVNGAKVAEPCAASQIHLLARVEADWTSASTTTPDEIINRHSSVLLYEFRDSRLLLDAWKIIDPEALPLRVPAEPVRKMAEKASLHTVFLAPSAPVEEKMDGVRGNLRTELPPRPSGVQVSFEKGRDEKVYWHDFHGLFRFVIRGGKLAEELASRFNHFRTETPGADLQFAVRDGRLVSRTGAALLEGKYAVTPNHFVESECVDLAKWEPGLVRSIRMESQGGNTILEVRPALESTVRSNLVQRKTIRRELSADDVLYEEIEPALQLELLKHRATFLHAAGVTVNGKAILFCGWKQMAKTALLLAFMKMGAGILGDDFVILSADGKVYSYPGRMNLYDHHLEKHPELAEAAAKLPGDGDIVRGSVEDFFPGRVQQSAPLHAVVLMGRWRRSSLQDVGTETVSQFNRVLLNEEFSGLRAASLAMAYGRSMATTELHEAAPLDEGLSRAKSLILRLEEDKDLNTVAEAILKHLGLI